MLHFFRSPVLIVSSSQNLHIYLSLYMLLCLDYFYSLTWQQLVTMFEFLMTHNQNKHWNLNITHSSRREKWWFGCYFRLVDICTNCWKTYLQGCMLDYIWKKWTQKLRTGWQHCIFKVYRIWNLNVNRYRLFSTLLWSFKTIILKRNIDWTNILSYIFKDCEKYSK